jgi:hypothetical protein
MAHHNSQQNNNPNGPGHVWSSLTPPLTAPIINQQQQQQQHQVTIHASSPNNMAVISSQPMSSWGSSITSHSSRSSQEKSIDDLFDKIEDMICDYMRDSKRHYLHCRVLRWSIEDDLTRQFSAVVVINPPTPKSSL